MMMLNNNLILLCLAISVTAFISCGQRTPSNSRNSSAKTENQSETVAETTETTEITEATEITATTANPTINVFIENSGSMDGYVKGVTEFEQTVYNFLCDIKIAAISDTLNLNYINSSIIKQGSDISDFIEKLEPTTFQAKGGNRGVSDISNVLNSILNKTSDHSISIFVSDCIFSPGKGKDATQYLVNQQIGIKKNWAEALKREKMAVCILQFSSQFDGYYYDKEDQRKQIKSKRPFYIWIIGKTNYLKSIREQIPDNRFKGSGVLNSFTIFPEANAVDYHFLANSGSFDKDKSSKHAITAIQKETKGKFAGKFTFGLGADLSEIEPLLGNSYLLDPQNYAVEINGTETSDFSIDIRNTQSDNSSKTYKFSTEKSPRGKVSISLKRNIPQWVYDSTDESGAISDFDAEKTYGLKYLIEGVHEAYDALGYKSYTSMKITIK